MQTLNVLFVEDSPDDVELETLELERNDFVINSNCVDNALDLTQALKARSWDLILCDNSMPQFSATAALQIVKENELDIPFIIVSGTIGEDLAVSCMKAGAHDYLMKGALARLVPAIRRELREAEVRREKTLAEKARQAAEEERSQLLVAERKAREEAENLYKEASRASRIKDEFLATVSHELRTPLQAILGWVELLQIHDKNDPQMLESALNIIHRNAVNQAKLIEELLDISRLNTGKLELNHAMLDFNSLIFEIITEQKLALQTKEINLRSELQSQSPLMITGDETRLRQVICNLLDNAIKFTPKGGNIILKIIDQDAHVDFSIEDNGEGIDASFIPFIFDKFRQENATSTRIHGGLGIGLGIVREIVNSHGGQVSVFSPGKGHGAKFTIQIPKAPQQHPQYRTFSMPSTELL